MFERFTDRARRVLYAAQEEAVEARHGFIGTEHVLLGLAREEGGIAQRVLTNHGLTTDTLRPKVLSVTAQFVADDLGIDEASALAAIGIDFELVRATIEATFGEGSLTADQARPPFTPKSKHALEESLRAALFLRHNFIGTEHLLMGFLEEPEGLARVVVTELGVDPDVITDEARRVAAPELARVNDLSEEIRNFELARLPTQDAATKAVLQTLSEGRVAAMQRETDALTAASAALAAELEELLHAALAADVPEPD